MRFILLFLFGCFSLHRMLLAIENDCNHQSFHQNLNPSKLLKTDREEDKREETVNKKNSHPPPKHLLTGSIAFLSDYRSRGISQNFLRPAVQGEFKYTHISGFYFKTWASNVDGTDNLLNNASTEWNIYCAITHQLFKSSIQYDTGFLFYYYPNGKSHVPGNTPYNTLEYYVSLEYKDFEVKLSQTLTDYFGINSSNPPLDWNNHTPLKPNGHSYGSIYLEANYKLSPYSKVTIDFHVGYQTVTHYSQMNYVDWLVMLTYEFQWFNFTLSYVDTNANKAFYNVPDHSYNPTRKNLGGSTIVAGVYRTF